MRRSIAPSGVFGKHGAAVSSRLASLSTKTEKNGGNSRRLGPVQSKWPGSNNEHVLSCLFKLQKLKRKTLCDFQGVGVELGGIMSGAISRLQKSDSESCHHPEVAKQHRFKVPVGKVC